MVKSITIIQGKQVIKAQTNRSDENYIYIVSDIGCIVPWHPEVDQYLGHCPLHRDKPELIPYHSQQSWHPGLVERWGKIIKCIMSR